jgi:transposase-like protein
MNGNGVLPYTNEPIYEMYLVPMKDDVGAAYRRFLSWYEAKYPKATVCLRKDENILSTFYDFQAEHWRYIRTTNPIESTFGTVRHQTRQTKGCGSWAATLTMVFKQALEAERHCRKLNGSQILADVTRGVPFVDVFIKKAI